MTSRSSCARAAGFSTALSKSKVASPVSAAVKSQTFGFAIGAGAGLAAGAGAGAGAAAGFGAGGAQRSRGRMSLSHSQAAFAGLHWLVRQHRPNGFLTIAPAVSMT